MQSKLMSFLLAAGTLKHLNQNLVIASEAWQSPDCASVANRDCRASLAMTMIRK